MNLACSRNFLCGMSETGYFPVVTRPTRVDPNNIISQYTLIDHIWSNFLPGTDHRAVVVDSAISDHMFPFFIFILHSVNGPSDQFSYLVYSERNIDRFKGSITVEEFVDVNEIENPCRAMSAFIDVLVSKYNESFPLRTGNRHRKGNFPWIDDDLKFLIKKKNRFLKYYRRGLMAKSDFTRFRNLLQYVIRQRKRFYYFDRIRNCNGNSKESWRVLNDMLNRSADQPQVTLRENGVILSAPSSARVFNEYFTSIARDVVSRVTLGRDDDGNLMHGNAADMGDRFLNSFDPIDDDEMQQMIVSWQSERCSKDQFQPFLLPIISNVIVPVLRQILNNSLTAGIYPRVLKESRVVPVYKQGCRFSKSNYRPISTTSVFNKIFEKLLLKRLKSYFDSVNVLSDCQYGFRSGRGTTDALVRLVEDIADNFNGQLYTICLFVDLRKALDTVDREKLLRKLNDYGVRNVCLGLLRSYLTDRKQRVVVGESYSEFLENDIGVPQGSILAPFLFNLYIDDLVRNVRGCKSILYADDAVLYVSDSSLPAAIDKIAIAIQGLERWLCSNALVANEDKTKLMLFYPKIPSAFPAVTFNGIQIEWVSSFKYLGVILDTKLSFNDHISKVRISASKGLGAMRSVAKFLPSESLKTLYFSLVYPHLIYSIIVWGGVSESKLSPLQVVMNRALRVILGVSYNINGIPMVATKQMYVDLELMQLRDIYRFHILKFVRRALYNNECDYDRYIRPFVPVHDYPTRVQRYTVPAIRLETERHLLKYRLIDLLNVIPENLLSPMSVFTLKHSYKEYVLDCYRSQ